MIVLSIGIAYRAGLLCHDQPRYAARGDQRTVDRFRRGPGEGPLVDMDSCDARWSDATEK